MIDDKPDKFETCSRIIDGSKKSRKFMNDA